MTTAGTAQCQQRPDRQGAFEKLGLLSILVICFLLSPWLEANLSSRIGLAETLRRDALKGFEEARAAEALRQFDRAIEGYREVVERWPHSPKAPEAQLRLAHILACTDKPEQALLEYQQVRTLFSNTPEAAAAFQQMSTYYRWQRARIGKVPAASADAALFTAKPLAASLPETLEDPRSAFVNSSGQLIILDRHRKHVLRLSPSGELVESVPFNSPQAMARPEYGGRGEIFVADGDLIRELGKGQSFNLANPQKRSEGSLKNITALGLSATGVLWATAQDLSGVLKYSLEGRTSETIPLALAPKNVRTIDFDFYGNVYFLDSKQNRILVVSPSGEARATISPESGGIRLSSITDFCIDPFNQLFLLDAEERVIAVFAVRSDVEQKIQFIPLTRIAWGQLNPSPEFRSVRTMAVDIAGEVFLVPHKSSRILEIF